MLSLGSQLSGTGGSTDHQIGVRIEFWNRRKYPVVVRHIQTVVSGVEIREGLDVGPDNEFVQRNVVTQKVDAAVASNAHGAYRIAGTIGEQSLDALRVTFKVSVVYFDPIKGKAMKATLEHKLFHPELGWSKTEAEREQAREAFRVASEQKKARRPDLDRQIARQ